MFRKDIRHVFERNFYKKLYENVKIFFDLFCEIIIIQKAASKITRYGVKLQRENAFAVYHVERKPGNDPKTRMKRDIFHNHQENYQFQSIKSNKEVTPKTRENYFLYRKTQKLKFVENVFLKMSSKSFSSRGKSHSVENTKSGQLLQK